MIGYHVIMSAFKSLANSTEIGDGFCYVDKTADLQIKIEPEKSIDLDDGRTEVGAVKITVSFSTLADCGTERARYLHLVPVDFMHGTSYVIDMKQAVRDVTALESKTGEFERWQVTFTKRLPVEALEGVLVLNEEVGYDKIIVVFPRSCESVTVEPAVGGPQLDASPLGDERLWGICLPLGGGSYSLFCRFYEGSEEFEIDPEGGLYYVGEDKSIRRIA